MFRASRRVLGDFPQVCGLLWMFFWVFHNKVANGLARGSSGDYFVSEHTRGSAITTPNIAVEET
jgi:hypothetical protein